MIYQLFVKLVILSLWWQPKPNIVYIATIPTVEVSVISCKTENNLMLLTALVNSESRREPIKGKLLVAQCVWDRVSSKHFPNTLEKVIYQRGQFDGIRNKYFRYEHHIYIDLKKFYFKKKIIDQNILWFYNPKISTDKRFVKWVSKFKSYTVGNHKFHYI